MQYLTYNQRGSRAFDRRTEKIIALALTLTGFSGLMAHADPGAKTAGLVQPLPSVSLRPLTPKKVVAPVKVKQVSSSSTPQDVTLDFVGADINDVLKALAMQTHSNIVSGTDVKGTITVSLAHVTLEEALDLISKLSGYQYAKVGRTYVIGSPASITSLTASGAAVLPNGTAVIQYTYSQPDDVIGILKQLIPNLKATPGKSSGTQTGGVFVLTGTQADVDQARVVIAQAESTLSRGIAVSRTQVYNVKYALADDLEGILSRLVPNVVVTPGPSLRLAPSAPSTADAGGTTSTTTSFGTAAGAAVPNGGTTVATSGNAVVKPTTLSLLLTGSDADIAHALAILAQVDTRPAQINYEAKITEISLLHAKNLGLLYDFTNTGTIVGETGAFNTLSHKTLSLGALARTPISSLVNIQLNALVANNDAKILAAPNISAIDGQPAGVFVGDTVSYISSITQSATGQNITTSTVNAGIKLYVTGKVNNDGTVTLNVHPEVSLVTLSSPGSLGIQVPDVRVREATTTVRVHDGETIAIGGLINDQETSEIKKVPFFGDLPFFGNLFRNTNRSHTRDEVVIFLKVSIQKETP